MPVTIKVNGNSLVHKGSGGVSTATVPDVCKTPSPGGPVPIPYPNISRSVTLANGTTTVSADGGMMIANKGSEFSSSIGDNPGVLGGVTSGTFMKESTWILYSFDVKMEGKGACRLTDKKFQNHGNTVDLAGVLQPQVIAEGLRLGILPELQHICDVKCDCQNAGQGQICITQKLWKEENDSLHTTTIKAEPRYNMIPDVPEVIPSKKVGQRSTRSLPSGSRAPDVVIVHDGTKLPTADNIKAVVEIKLGKDTWQPGREADYAEIAGGRDKMVELNDSNCKCGDEEKVKEKVPVPLPVPVKKRSPFGLPSLDKVVPVVATVGAIALVGAALILLAPEALAGAAAVAVIGLFVGIPGKGGA
jgi:hypothetical protein